jgi:hypothetical protein
MPKKRRYLLRSSRIPHCDPVKITRYRGIREDRACLGLDLGLLVAAGEV